MRSSMRDLRMKRMPLCLVGVIFITSCSTFSCSGQDTRGEDKKMEMFSGVSFWAVALSSDGKWILTGGDKIVQLWDVESGKEKIHFKGHGEDVMAVAFSPDGRWILS